MIKTCLAFQKLPPNLKAFQTKTTRNWLFLNPYLLEFRIYWNLAPSGNPAQDVCEPRVAVHEVAGAGGHSLPAWLCLRLYCCSDGVPEEGGGVCGPLSDAS